MQFLLAVLLFGVTVIATSVIAFDYYILVREIQNLKKITGYKKENEFKLPEFNLSKVKSHQAFFLTLEVLILWYEEKKKIKEKC